MFKNILIYYITSTLAEFDNHSSDIVFCVSDIHVYLGDSILINIFRNCSNQTKYFSVTIRIIM